MKSDCVKEPGTMISEGDSRYLTIAMAAQYLKVSLRQFMRLRHEIPCARVGRRKLIFDRSDLDKFVELRKSRPECFVAD